MLSSKAGFLSIKLEPTLRRKNTLKETMSNKLSHPGHYVEDYCSSKVEVKHSSFQANLIKVVIQNI